MYEVNYTFQFYFVLAAVLSYIYSFMNFTEVSVPNKPMLTFRARH